MTEAGSFRLNLQAAGRLPPFTIGNPLTTAAEAAARSLLGFFMVQRCGRRRQGSRRLSLDAHHIVGGPNAPLAVNVQGGWHDAGGYIKL